jgi:hypothetical protein
VLDGLACNRLGQKADKVAGMAGVKRHADLAFGFEAAYPRPMTCAGIDDNERAFSLINFDARGWDDPDE